MPDIPVQASSSTDPEKCDPAGSRGRSASVASDDTSTASASFEQINFTDPEKQLAPQVSRGSSRLRCSSVVSNLGGTPVRKITTTDPIFEVDFEDADPANPLNWPLWYKSCVLAAVSLSTWVVVLYSTSYTTGFDQMIDEFHTSEAAVTLGITTYLVGLAVGSVVLAPISETYGRRPVYVGAMLIFALLIIPCALADSIISILVVRFLGACAGSAAISNAPGTIADIISDDYRALAFSIWSIGPVNGPVFGPVIGGFVTQYLGWRWTHWVVLILSGMSWVVVCGIKETYIPILLQRRAHRLRGQTGDDRYWSRYDERMPLAARLRINLSRPFIMTFFEPIVIFFNVFIALIYGILYLCFVAYPIVFQDHRGWDNGISGLAFLGIGCGSLLIIALEPAIRRMINKHEEDPETNKPPPEAMMSIVCIGACLTPIGELWFAWTCYPTHIHWIWPILAGIPFGAGNTTIFIYASNYLAHSYGIYSASAMASNAIIRSLLGGTLPLAGPSLYDSLGPNWAGTLLGCLEILIVPIPFVFYKWGHRIRMRSEFIRRMQEDKKRVEGKRANRLQGTEDKGPVAGEGEVTGVRGPEVTSIGDGIGIVNVREKEKDKEMV